MRVALNAGTIVQIFVLTIILGPIFLGLLQNVLSIFGKGLKELNKLPLDQKLIT